MNTEFEKIYTNATPYKIVVCIDTSECKLLKDWTRYYVIDENETQYHIQFPKSLGTKWYAKERFIVPKLAPILDPALEKQINNLLNTI